MSESFEWSKLANIFTGVYWVKVVLYTLSAGFLIFVGLGVYKAYFKAPLPTTDQEAELIVNHYNTPRSTFGCATTRTYAQYPSNRVR